MEDDHEYEPEHEADTAEDIARATREARGILERAVRGTVRIDFTSLQPFRILDEFWVLVQRVGFTRQFFSIPVHHRAVPTLTREFFSTVCYHSGSAVEDHLEPFIGFYLGGVRRTLTMATLRTLLHLPTDFQQSSYAFPEDDQGVPVTTLVRFWSQISNHPYTDDRVTLITHPVLRFTIRTMSMSLFARGETGLRPLEQELQLLYHMLLPEPQVHDLALYMVQYWETLQRSTRNTGPLHGGAYVSLIASHFHIELGDDGAAEEVCDPATFTRFRWTTRRGRRTVWLATGLPERPFPLEDIRPLSFTDPTTWRIDLAPPAPAPPLHQPPLVQGDIDMIDAAPPPPPPEAYGWAQVQASFERLFTGQAQIQEILAQQARSLAHLHERVDYLYDYQRRWDRGWGPGETSHHAEAQPEQQPEAQPEEQHDEQQE